MASVGGSCGAEGEWAARVAPIGTPSSAERARSSFRVSFDLPSALDLEADDPSLCLLLGS